MFGFSYRPFSDAEEVKIVETIANEEKKTAAEIKLHVTKYCKGDPMLAAGNVFEKLEMSKTIQRNGILIFLALEDHKVAILGDEGINSLVENDFWDCTLELMITHFKRNEVAEGVCTAIERVGEKLTIFFPNGDKKDDELSNDISYG